MQTESLKTDIPYQTCRWTLGPLRVRWQELGRLCSRPIPDRCSHGEDHHWCTRHWCAATAKHFIGNEQETQRNPTYNYLQDPTASYTEVIQEAVSANIDDRTIHELYLWPFANAVHANVASIMSSYQRLNGSYACQNSKVQNGLLKEELGFQGCEYNLALDLYIGIHFLLSLTQLGGP